MGHLVKSLPIEKSGRLPLIECRALIEEAHDYLARQGASVAQKVLERNDPKTWGSDLKRIRVPLPRKGRPHTISCDGEDHNYVEVVNQCATMERLLDALTWAISPTSKLSEFTVQSCHPTTSSQTEDGEKASHDNDLVLVSATGTKARFEVSDVASNKDGNGKEKKDLISLDVLVEGTGREQFSASWPDSRLFLVVSGQFARHVEKPNRTWLKGPNAHCHYVRHSTHSDMTVVFEVMSGPKP